MATSISEKVPQARRHQNDSQVFGFSHSEKHTSVRNSLDLSLRLDTIRASFLFYISKAVDVYEWGFFLIIIYNYQKKYKIFYKRKRGRVFVFVFLSRLLKIGCRRTFFKVFVYLSWHKMGAGIFF